MDSHVVFVKTEKGEAEIVSRAHKLNHGLRYALILVDGKSTVGEILTKSAGLPQIELALTQLATNGFIRTLIEAKKPQIAARDPKGELIALARSLLGNQAGTIEKKLRESESSPDALAQTASACKRLIKLSIDEQKAEEFLSRAQEIIYASSLHAH